MGRLAPFIAIAVLLVVVVAVVMAGRVPSTSPEREPRATLITPIVEPTQVPEATPTAAPTVAGQETTPAPSVAPVAQPSATPQVVPTQAPSEPVAPPSPTATPAPAVIVHPYQISSSGNLGFGLSISTETTVYAPFAGAVKINSRSIGGKNYPSFTLKAGEGSSAIFFALGVEGDDVQLLVKNGNTVASGTPLFKVTGFGPSYWKFVYDSSISFQIVGSWTGPDGYLMEVNSDKAREFLTGRS